MTLQNNKDCCSAQGTEQVTGISASPDIFRNEHMRTIVLTVLSGLFLLMSFVTSIRPFGIDLAWGTILISGTPIVLHSLKSLFFQGNIRAGLLITIALFASIAVGEYFAAGEVVFIMTLGEMLEDYTVQRSRAGLRALVAMQPTTARVLREGEYVAVDAAELAAGDIVRVNAGETVPVDGVITQGNTSIDQSVLTGESIPVDKAMGDEVYCATTNMHGSILVRATQVGENSSLVKMITMITEAEKNKAPIVRTMDKWASYLVIVALILSVLIGVVTDDIIRGITVLIVFCPCALVLATPTAIAAGIGNATRHGIIIKSGEALEGLSNVARMAFDKTGTLTYGKPQVQDIFILPGSDISREDFITLVASAEQHSEHPLGLAIARYAHENTLSLHEPEEFTVLPGQGIQARIQGTTVLIGNQALLQAHSISVSADCIQQKTAYNEAGNTVIFVAMNGQVGGLISLADTLRPQSAELVSTIRGFGTQLTLLTGDSTAIAQTIAHQAGITEYQAELLPEDKVHAVAEFEQNGEKVCMIGDGINDAPALKTAHIGIAMADIGSDIAADSADIVLVKDDLEKIPYLMQLSRAVARKVRQNIVLSLTLNFGAIALAGLGEMGPVAGALFHNLSSVLVVLNAALLLKYKA